MRRFPLALAALLAVNCSVPTAPSSTQSSAPGLAGEWAGTVRPTSCAPAPCVPGSLPLALAMGADLSGVLTLGPHAFTVNAASSGDRLALAGGGQTPEGRTDVRATLSVSGAELGGTITIVAGPQQTTGVVVAARR